MSGMPRNSVYREEKKSIVTTHLASKKRGDGKGKLKKSKLKDQTTMEAFRAGNRTQKDSTLP